MSVPVVTVYDVYPNQESGMELIAKNLWHSAPKEEHRGYYEIRGSDWPEESLSEGILRVPVRPEMLGNHYFADSGVA